MQQIQQNLFRLFNLEFWNIVNVHNAGIDLRTLNPVKSVIRTREDTNLKKPSHMAELADRMYPRDNPRVKTLTRDTATALSHTCRDLIELSEHLFTKELYNYAWEFHFRSD